MHRIKEFILHGQGYSQRACFSAVRKKIWRYRRVGLGCVLLLGDLLALCIALTRVIDCAKKRKEKRKNKATLSHLILPIASSYLQTPSLLTWRSVLSQSSCTTSVFPPHNQNSQPSAGLTCILIVFVSLCRHRGGRLTPAISRVLVNT